MAGRKHVPDYMKVEDGGKSGTRVPSKAVPPPDTLSDLGKRVWVEFEAVLREMGAFRPDYTTALETACELRADMIDLRREIQAQGRFYKTTNAAGDIMIRPHPAAGQLADTERRLGTFLSEFGLTPVGRAKLLSKKVEADDRTSDPTEAFFKKG